MVKIVELTENTIVCQCCTLLSYEEEDIFDVCLIGCPVCGEEVNILKEKL